MHAQAGLGILCRVPSPKNDIVNVLQTALTIPHTIVQRSLSQEHSSAPQGNNGKVTDERCWRPQTLQNTDEGSEGRQMCLLHSMLMAPAPWSAWALAAGRCTRNQRNPRAVCTSEGPMASFPICLGSEHGKHLTEGCLGAESSPRWAQCPRAASSAALHPTAHLPTSPPL